MNIGFHLVQNVYLSNYSCNKTKHENINSTPFIFLLFLPSGKIWTKVRLTMRHFIISGLAIRDKNNQVLLI